MSKEMEIAKCKSRSPDPTRIEPLHAWRTMEWALAMHELSIALSMIDVATEEAQRQGGGGVLRSTSS